MSKISERLQLRRQVLIAKSQAERMLVVLHVQQLKQSLTLADVGVRIAKKLVQRPIMGIGVVLASFVITPRRLLPLLKKALSVWQIWQLVAPSLRHFSHKKNAGAATLHE